MKKTYAQVKAIISQVVQIFSPRIGCATEHFVAVWTFDARPSWGEVVTDL